jgi:ABC-type transport system involved in Fe-S cluster assembly fused permease/ATPase subunit
VCAGSVLIDGQDVLKVTGESVRDNVAVVLQDGALFDESLMYNIQYGKEGCTEQVKQLDTPLSPRSTHFTRDQSLTVTS